MEGSKLIFYSLLALKFRQRKITKSLSIINFNDSFYVLEAQGAPFDLFLFEIVSTVSAKSLMPTFIDQKLLFL